MQALDEGFNASMVSMKQFCRVTNLSVVERRRVFLEELKLKPYPLSLTSSLPVDLEQGLLFGKEELKEGKSNTIESIIS